MSALRGCGPRVNPAYQSPTAEPITGKNQSTIRSYSPVCRVCLATAQLGIKHPACIAAKRSQATFLPDSPALSFRNFSNAAFTSSACVHVMQCGPPLTIDC